MDEKSYRFQTRPFSNSKTPSKAKSAFPLIGCCRRTAAGWTPRWYCYVAEEGGELVGTYVLHPNRKGAGSHEEARAAGYRAMQFSFVLASNHRAIGLWQRMGFQIVGRVSEAFLHPVQGHTDALVMYQRL